MRGLKNLRRRLGTAPRRGRNLPTMPAEWFLETVPGDWWAAHLVVNEGFDLKPTTRPYQRKSGEVRVRLTWVKHCGTSTTCVFHDMVVPPLVMLSLLPVRG